MECREKHFYLYVIDNFHGIASVFTGGSAVVSPWMYTIRAELFRQIWWIDDVVESGRVLCQVMGVYSDGTIEGS